MISCIAIDDEPLALQQIKRYIDDTPGLSLEASFESAVQAIAYLQEKDVDLMFVDINMPDLNGMDFVKSLFQPPKVIFTTAYSEYAVEGFRVDAIDYLLKPIGYGDFLKAAQKAISFFKLRESSSTKGATDVPFILMKSGYQTIRINLSDIKYIEGMREYVRVHLTNHKPVMSLFSMKKLEEQLPKEHFMRVHRSYIIRLDKIVGIERNRILMGNEIYIPVSKQYTQTLQGYMDKNSMK